MSPLVDRPIQIKYFSEPLLQFGYGQEMQYPRDGLFLFGPNSEHRIPEVRFGAIGSPEGLRRLKEWAISVASFIDTPESSASAKEIQAQHVAFPGFRQAFDAEWDPESMSTISDVDPNEIAKALRIGNRHEAVKLAVNIYVDRLVEAQNRMENPPAFWFVVIPEDVYKLGRPLSRVPAAEREPGSVRVSQVRARQLEVQPTLFGLDEKEAEVYKYAAHFRRQLKARLLKDRIVTQIVRETTLTPHEFVTEGGWPLRQIEDPATVAWKLCTGAYYKAGGRPWQLANVRQRVCYVGLVYKRTSLKDKDRFACCAAQMFLSDGEGVVFRGALGPWFSPNTKEFHLDRISAEKLIDMVIQEYRRLHNEDPSELFIHAQSAFADTEWQGFERACPEATNLVGVQIRDARDNLKLFRRGKYPVLRGTAAILTERNAFLWTAGYIPRLDTYMGPETPNPIQVKVIRGNCELETVLEDVLGLTKINFNSCLFNDRLPVTIRFANAVGEVLVSAPTDGEPKLPFKYYI